LNKLRPDWNEYFLGIAVAVSARADCTRRKVGYVLVDTDHRIISTGYNGALPGRKGCLEGFCPRSNSDVAPGSSYDTGPGTCIALHAEQNALLYAYRTVQGALAYGTDWPCDGCMRLLRGARIAGIVTPGKSVHIHLS
jgi:dCMP deaminase